MITPETPHKLAEIIRDTWPGLYRAPKECYNDGSTNNKNEEGIQPNTQSREKN